MLGIIRPPNDSSVTNSHLVVECETQVLALTVFKKASGAANSK